MARPGDTLRNITAADVSDPAKLAVLLNAFADNMLSALRGRLSFKDNFNCYPVQDVFTHGVAKTIATPFSSTRGVLILNCGAGHSTTGYTLTANSNKNAATLTVFFRDAKAVGVPVFLLLFPEGLGDKQTPQLGTASTALATGTALYIYKTTETVPGTVFAVPAHTTLIGMLVGGQLLTNASNENDYSETTVTQVTFVTSQTARPYAIYTA